MCVTAKIKSKNSSQQLYEPFIINDETEAEFKIRKR